MSSCSRGRKVLMNHALHARACQPRNSAHICHLSDNHLNQILSITRRYEPRLFGNEAHRHKTPQRDCWRHTYPVCLNTELRWAWKAWWQFVCNYLHSFVIERSGVRISNQLLLPVPSETFCGFPHSRSRIIISYQNILVNLDQSSRPSFTVNNFVYQKRT